MNDIQKTVLTGGILLLSFSSLAQDTIKQPLINIGWTIGSVSKPINAHHAPSLRMIFPTKSGFNFGFGADFYLNPYTIGMINNYVEVEEINLYGKIYPNFVYVNIGTRGVLEGIVSKTVSNKDYGIGVGLDFREKRALGGFVDREVLQQYLRPYFEAIFQSGKFNYSLGFVPDGKNSTLRLGFRLNIQPSLKSWVDKYGIGEGGYKDNPDYKHREERKAIKQIERAQKRYLRKGERTFITN